MQMLIYNHVNKSKAKSITHHSEFTGRKMKIHIARENGLLEVGANARSYFVNNQVNKYTYGFLCLAMAINLLNYRMMC